MRPVLLAILLGVPASLHSSFVSNVAAQSPLTQVKVQGMILDPTRAPIAGAVVTAVAERRSQSASTTTNARGEFEFSLAPGRYTVTARADGFVEVAQPLSVSSADTSAQEFILQIAGLRDTVTVSGGGRYTTSSIATATKTPTPLRDVPQSVTVVTKDLIQDQLMMSVGDVMRYVPGVSVHQGENNRDQIIVRGNSSSADFYIDGVRDDVQYYRDLYNVERIEALKGPNAMIFGRGGAGGVVNRVMKSAGFQPLGEFSLQGGMNGHKRATAECAGS